MIKKKISERSINKSVTSRKFAIDVSWVVGSIFISLISGILLRILVGNYFGPKGLGLFSMIIVITTLSAMIGDFGVPATLIKFISEYQEDKKRVNKFISCSLINAFFIGLIITFVLFVFAEQIATLFNMPELTQLLRLVSFMFPLHIVNDVFIGVFNGHRWMNKYTLLISIRTSGLIIIGWLLILLGGGVTGVILALVLKEVVTLFFNFLMIRKYKLKIRIKGHFAQSKELFKFSKFLLFSDGIWFINSYIDTFLIGYFLTDKNVGVYAVAVMIARFFITIPLSINRISYPMTSELYGKKDYKKIDRLLNLCMRYSFIIISILGLFIIFYGKMVIQIVYPSHSDFLFSYYPLTILIIGATFRSTALSINGVFSAFGRPDIILKISGISALINISLNILLIPIFGLNGAALATTISLSGSTFIVYYLLNRIEEINIETKWLIIGLPLFLITVTLFFAFNEILNYYILTTILYSFFIIIIYISKIFSKKDIKQLREMFLKKRAPSP